jgi:hypothetical protein
MLRILGISLVALTISTSAFAGKCSMSSASGLGVSKEIAMFMSNKALHDMIAKNGETGKGKVTTTCDSSAVVTTTCTSKQRSCK